MISIIKTKVPAKIVNVFSTKDKLIIETDKWLFKSSERWRARNEKIMLYGYYDEITNNNVNVKKLSGNNVIDIFTQSSFFDEDPVFVLENGLFIEFFSSIFAEPSEFILK